MRTNDEEEYCCWPIVRVFGGIFDFPACPFMMCCAYCLDGGEYLCCVDESGRSSNYSSLIWDYYAIRCAQCQDDCGCEINRPQNLMLQHVRQYGVCEVLKYFHQDGPKSQLMEPSTPSVNYSGTPS